VIALHLTDAKEHFHMELSNGALIHYPTTENRVADLTVTLTRPQLLGLLIGGETAGIDMSGDAGVLAKLVSLTDSPDPDFAVVTP
jgi:alkyl sulfatase BDS1-like metallo-beta-lactamase superfamily hydrolase